MFLWVVAEALTLSVLVYAYRFLAIPGYIECSGGSEHAAKLGVLVAHELCMEYGGKMFTVNPTNVDELCEYARMTGGISGLYRNAQTHAPKPKGGSQLSCKIHG